MGLGKWDQAQLPGPHEEPSELGDHDGGICPPWAAGWCLCPVQTLTILGQGHASGWAVEYIGHGGLEASAHPEGT